MALNMKVTYKSNADKVSADFKRAAEKALTTSALLVEGDAKLRAPVDTGNLRSSLNHKVETDRATIGTNVEYAPFVEFSTSRTPAQPFLEPALRENKGKIQKIFAEHIRNATK